MRVSLASVFLVDLFVLVGVVGLVDFIDLVDFIYSCEFEGFACLGGCRGFDGIL